jgi:hypothetical protein
MTRREVNNKMNEGGNRQQYRQFYVELDDIAVRVRDEGGGSSPFSTPTN